MTVQIILPVTTLKAVTLAPVMKAMKATAPSVTVSTVSCSDYASKTHRHEK